ncbi:hypothetical protein ABT133_29300 [Streptomyces sp. NPDC001835]|uniref:hypothetical protein n=1 Tax=Streptomyces sp. NPDC001835 TaxID=3154528 RepID=UPI0033254D62
MAKVLGTSDTDDGVLGVSQASGKAGVAGVDENGGNGLYGRGLNGVWGHGKGGDGILGLTEAAAKSGVAGVNDHGGNGLYGRGRTGVAGDGKGGNGVYGVSDTEDGVIGVGTNSAKAGVAGVNDNGGNGVYARGRNGIVAVALTNPGGGKAGVFQGDVEVTGDLILTGGDVAEEFNVSKQVSGPTEVGPGTVVVLDSDGSLAPCEHDYDTSVAGAVAGAGDRVPALVLDRQPREVKDGVCRSAVAVTGKVWCHADASSRPIRVGNLLTTSSTPGHAMAALDRDAAFGAVLGKALTPLVSGRGLVLVLVGLG